MDNNNNNSFYLKIGLAVITHVVLIFIAVTCSPTGDPGTGGGTNAPNLQERQQTPERSPKLKTEKTTKKPEDYLTAKEMNQWSVVVMDFRVAIGASGKNREQWLKEVQPLVTPKVYAQLKTVAEENMLHGMPYGQPSGIRHGDNYVIFQDAWAKPDTWKARYMVQKVDDKWLISSYQLSPNTGK